MTILRAVPDDGFLCPKCKTPAERMVSTPSGHRWAVHTLSRAKWLATHGDATSVVQTIPSTLQCLISTPGGKP